jgi:hypothetical protein
MAEFSEDTLRRFRDFRRAKTSAALSRVGQVVGGGAETLRTGRSAAQTFAERDPELERLRTRQRFLETQKARMGIIGDLEARERFELTQEQDRAKTQLQASLREAEMILNQEARNADRIQQASYQRESLRLQKLRQQGQELDDLRTDFEEIKPATQKVFDDLFGRGQTRRQSVAQIKATQGEQLLTEASRALSQQIEATGLEEEVARVQDQIRQGVNLDSALDTVADEDIKKALKRQIDSVARNLQIQSTASPTSQLSSEDLESKLNSIADADQLSIPQRALAIQTALEQSGLDEASRNDALLNAPRALDMISEAKEDFDNLGKADEAYMKEVKRDVRVGGGSVRANDALGNVAKAAQNLSEVGRAPRYEVGQAIRETIPEAREGVGVTRDMDEPQADLSRGDMFGTGVSPAPTASERMLQTLDLIERYPDQPALQYTRDTIMNSPEFAEFRKHYGYDQPGQEKLAFREMNRMARQQQAQARKDFRARRNLNIQQGLGGYQRKPEQMLPKTPERKQQQSTSAEIVQGTDSRIAEEG